MIIPGSKGFYSLFTLSQSRNPVSSIFIDLVKELQIEKVRAKIPKILLGTSPFAGAGQFGFRALSYLRKFYNHPEAIVRIIERSIDLGITGIQLLPYPHILSAVKFVKSRFPDLTIVGTLMPEDPYRDIHLLAELRADAMLIHGEITDACNIGEVKDLLSSIRKAGSLAGIATHKPLHTLSWILESGIKVDVAMFPFNKVGKFMDGKAHEILDVAKKLKAHLIAKKVLAAGELKPEEAIEFVLQKGINSIAIGVASEEEAEETFSIANRLISKYQRL